MTLTEEQVGFLEEEIQERGITVPSLSEDLLDHFCCTIEAEMESGIPFDTAYRIAYMHICPEGLKEFDRATQSIILQHKYSAMKKTTFILGFATAFLFIIGCFFKLMHWPGANELMLFDAMLFSLIFLPMYFTLKYKADKELNMEKPKWTYFLNNLMVSYLVLMVPYTAIKFPGAIYVVLIGLALFLFVFLPRVFLNWYKNLHPNPVEMEK